MIMDKAVPKQVCTLLVSLLLTTANLRGFQEQQTQSGDESTFGSRFFDQLHSIFGRFRDSDLQRVFQESQPIQCSELVGRKGEWRSVAFFNEDRKLGDWCRETLDEVKSDLAVYTFKGNCTEDRGTVEVTTEFPTAASIEDYGMGKVDLAHVDITVNDPVKAVLNPRTQAYTFELPYLFLSERDLRKVYSFMAPDRNASYASDVSSRWECKAVASKDVTYRFMICRVGTVPQRLAKNQKWEPSFGSSAFFILSDGTEAKTSVNLTFGDGAKPAEEPAADKTPDSREPAKPALKRPVLKRDKLL
jgi:hypothetical protein